MYFSDDVHSMKLQYVRNETIDFFIEFELGEVKFYHGMRAC